MDRGSIVICRWVIVVGTSTYMYLELTEFAISQPVADPEAKVPFAPRPVSLYKI